MLFYDTALVPDLENFRWWKNPLFQTIASLIAVLFFIFPLIPLSLVGFRTLILWLYSYGHNQMDVGFL